VATSLPPNTGNNHPGYSMNNANASAHHRPATTATWSELNARLEQAVQDGRLTQAQANQILSHIAQKHNLNG
jgi:hypothetical protein